MPCGTAWSIAGSPATASALFGNNGRLSKNIHVQRMSTIPSPNAYNPKEKKAQALASNGSNGNSSASVNQLRQLYPATTMRRNGTISVHSPTTDGEGHVLYYEVYGEGKVPALFLHGGPGAGCFPRHAQFFDPDHYMVVLLDQRGCGRSTPRGEVCDNDIGFLVRDIEILRLELNLEQWKVVLGGSWGSTLAIAYAQSYPSKVGSLVLRGVCLMRSQEVNWLFSSKGGAAALNQEAWKQFADPVLPAITLLYKDGKGDISGRGALHEYCNWLVRGNAKHRINASQRWMRWEFAMSKYKAETNGANIVDGESCVLVYDGEKWTERDTNDVVRGTSMKTDVGAKAETLRKLTSESPKSEIDPYMLSYTPVEPRMVAPDIKLDSFKGRNVTQEQLLSYIPAQVVLTCLYSVNNGFIDGTLLDYDRMNGIQHIPCIAVHGGQDHICPVDSALDLQQAWKNMKLRIPLSAGHSMYDPEILNELIRATDKLRY